MTTQKVSDKAILAQLPAARRRARLAQALEPHAAVVRYHLAGRVLQVTLANRAGMIVPVDLIPALDGASDQDLDEVTIGPAGVGLRWDRLDVDLTVAGLATLAIGIRTLRRAAGAAGGAVRSAAKRKSSRLNGLKGGRPPKTSPRSTSVVRARG